MEKHFYSCGKLLLTGEYAVLKGASAIALPTQLGQHLYVHKSNKSNSLKWTAKDHLNKIWFACSFNLENMEVLNTSDIDVSKRLVEMLQFCKKRSNFLEVGSFEVTTKTDFPIHFGLGTSSTLINNLAYWANIDPYPILRECFSGSGFDLAVAQCNSAVTYNLHQGHPEWIKTNIEFPFEDHLHFIYLNKKAISRESIKGKIDFDLDQLKRISEITKAISKAESLDKFETLMSEHEKIIAQGTGKISIKDNLFPNFDGVIKSLGAWGGDFILATGKNIYVEDFFKSKGYNSIFNYSELILKP